MIKVEDQDFFLLELLKYQKHLETKEVEGKKYLWDPVRKQFNLLQKEELVRILLIYYLVEEKNFPLGRMAVEKQIDFVSERGKMSRRFDLLVYCAKGKPLFLVECKAPSVGVDVKTLEQVSKYNNRAVRSRYIMITDGMKAMVGKVIFENEQLIFLNEIPLYEKLED